MKMCVLQFMCLVSTEGIISGFHYDNGGSVLKRPIGVLLRPIASYCVLLRPIERPILGRPPS